MDIFIGSFIAKYTTDINSQVDLYRDGIKMKYGEETEVIIEINQRVQKEERRWSKELQKIEITYIYEYLVTIYAHLEDPI